MCECVGSVCLACCNKSNLYSNDKIVCLDFYITDIYLLSNNNSNNYVFLFHRNVTIILCLLPALSTKFIRLLLLNSGVKCCRLLFVISSYENIIV